MFPRSTTVSAVTLVGARVVAVVLASVAPAQSDHARDLVQPDLDRIELCQAALQEIQRQSEERLTELSDWKSFYHGAAKQAVDAFVGLWIDGESKKLKQLKEIEATALRMGRQAKDWVGLPHSKGRMFHLRDGIDRTTKGYAGLKASLAKKAKELRIAFVGAVRDIAVKAHEIEAQSAKIRDQVSKGEYRIQYPGLGEVWRKRLEGMIKHHETSKRNLLDAISKGNYKVLVPGIGWHTRNSLEAEIERVEAQILATRKSFETGEQNLYRPLFYWQKRKAMISLVKSKADVVARQKKWRTDPLFKIYFPSTYEWLDEIDLDKRIKDVEKGITAVNDAVRDGTYKVYTHFYGHVDRNRINKLLDDVGRQLSNSKLSAKAREQLNARVNDLKKGLKDIQTVSALDLVIRNLDKTWWMKALGALVSLAKPELEGRQLDLRQDEAHLPDYKREMQLHILPQEQLLRRLRRGLAYIP